MVSSTRRPVHIQREILSTNPPVPIAKLDQCFGYAHLASLRETGHAFAALLRLLVRGRRREFVKDVELIVSRLCRARHEPRSARGRPASRGSARTASPHSRVVTRHDTRLCLLTPVFEVGADLATDAPHAHPLPTMPWRDLLTHQAGRVVVEDHGFFRLACVERGHPGHRDSLTCAGQTSIRPCQTRSNERAHRLRIAAARRAPPSPRRAHRRRRPGVRAPSPCGDARGTTGAGRPGR